MDLTTGGNQRAFARKTGISVNTLRDIVGPRKSIPSFTKLKRIIDSLPTLNIHWFMKEEGEPFLSDYQKEEELLSLYNKINNSIFLSSNLKTLREHINEGQGTFARIFGKSRDNIASYERGSKPDLPLIIQIVKHFHISLEDFISNDLKEHPEILEKISVPDPDKEIKESRKSSSK
ncbi:MAG: helix-turn-helix transcriptional regulator [Mangrovibacterium sp.]